MSILAAVLTMMGSLFGVLVLVVIGVVVGLLTVLADFFSFGSNPGFGVQQKLGSFVGAIILLLGLRTMRRRGRTNSHQENLSVALAVAPKIADAGFPPARAWTSRAGNNPLHWIAIRPDGWMSTWLRARSIRPTF